jgi:hypothetical protein
VRAQLARPAPYATLTARVDRCLRSPPPGRAGVSLRPSRVKLGFFAPARSLVRQRLQALLLGIAYHL